MIPATVIGRFGLARSRRTTDAATSGKGQPGLRGRTSGRKDTATSSVPADPRPDALRQERGRLALVEQVGDRIDEGLAGVAAHASQVVGPAGRGRHDVHVAE